MRVRSIIRFIARGAIVLPLLAFGHSTEFLDAKFYFDPSGKAHVEITANYAGNPMLSTKEEAEAALRHAIALSFGDQQRALTDFAPQSIAPRDKPDPDSPMPSGPEDPNTPHSLLTASWQWLPTVPSLNFIVPHDSSQTVVFWMKEPGVKEPRWRMLLPGEMTPAIPIPPRVSSVASLLLEPLIFALALALVSGLWFWRRSSNHSRATKE